MTKLWMYGIALAVPLMIILTVWQAGYGPYDMVAMSVNFTDGKLHREELPANSDAVHNDVEDIQKETHRVEVMKTQDSHLQKKFHEAHDAIMKQVHLALMEHRLEDHANSQDRMESIQDPKKDNASDVLNQIPSFSRHRIQRISKDVHKDEGHHDKWIVVTSVSLPTDDVKFLANLTGWKVVVVADTKTPKDWSYPNCVFLSVSKQRDLGLSIEPQLPYKSYARKNVGYLYAIAHGAQVIYETDDDNRPLDRLQSFEMHQTTTGLMFAGKELMNPYRHFGQPTLWPRGFPLSKIGKENTNVYRFHDQWDTPAIQQGVVNGDPDMDAIFRLSRKLTLKPLHVRFDPAAPPVLLPAGVYSPFNSQNTLFLKEAFWGLFIPTTTSFRICDIWRGYWTQRLLWEIDGYLGFFPPNAYQNRNAHNYLADYESESFMYSSTERLLTFLTRWNCPVTLTFFQCAYKLGADMATEGYWEQGDVRMIKLWLEDLVRIEYLEPKRKNISRKYNLLFKPDSDSSGNAESRNENITKSDLEKRRMVTINSGSVVIFNAAIQTPPTIDEDAHSVAEALRHAAIIASMCPGFPVILTSTRSINKIGGGPFDDILLVIIFNWPFYTNVRYTETIYRPLFPNILYCGSNSTLFVNETKLLGMDLTFVEALGITGGHFSHICAVKAMQMKFNVKGYFITADDVLLNVWNLNRFDKNKVWMSEKRNIFNISANTGWTWWTTNMGESAFHASMDVLEKVSLSKENADTQNISSHKKKISHPGMNFSLPKDVVQPGPFLTQLHNNTGNMLYSIHAFCDVYYIPQRLRSSAVVYLNHFLAHNLFVELSVPLTLYGLEKTTNFETFTGTNLGMETQINAWSHFNQDNHFLHPVKLSKPENSVPLCNVYLPVLLARGHRPKL